MEFLTKASFLIGPVLVYFLLHKPRKYRQSRDTSALIGVVYLMSIMVGPVLIYVLTVALGF